MNTSRKNHSARARNCVCERNETTTHTHSSCPDLIRASITLRRKFFRRRWIAGSPVYANASPGSRYWSAEAVSEGGSPAMTSRLGSLLLHYSPSPHFRRECVAAATRNEISGE